MKKEAQEYQSMDPEYVTGQINRWGRGKGGDRGVGGGGGLA